jgi:protein gp37
VTPLETSIAGLQSGMVDPLGQVVRYPLPSGACGIAWTDRTLNPNLFGCSKVSEACRGCYAEAMAVRLARFGQAGYQGATVSGHWTGRVSVGPVETAVAKIAKLPKKGGYCFVTSMSDILHDDVSTDFILACFEAMRSRPDWIFQVLTKRAERWDEIEECLSLTGWPVNVWPGVTVESNKHVSRLDHLPMLAQTTFASIEPMLDLPLIQRRHAPSWAICGGESGEGWRPIDWPSVYELRDRCAELGTAFFMKQAAAFNPKKDLSDVPADLRIREMPRVVA